MVYETIAFVERELMAKKGTFYASLDADSEGEECTFYIWKKAEIDELLGDDAVIFNEVFNITKPGNWEHGNNVIHTEKSISEVAH